MDRFRINCTKNNIGYSLVELLVVIAIMGVIVGGSSIGINLLFSKDANRCATKLNDALTSARSITMSKEGDFSITVTTDENGYYVARISGESKSKDEEGNDVTTPIYEQVINLEGDNGKKIESIKYNGTVISSGSSLGAVIITFDKTKGTVYKINGNKSFSDEVIVFDIESKKGSSVNKYSKVQIITGTGKHFIGDMQ